MVERHLTPQDIHERYKVLNGAIYGLASHGTFMGAFKPGNRSRQVRGLYLAGGAAHPGPGMPMVMMSGWIAADALDRTSSGGRCGGRRDEPATPPRRLPVARGARPRPGRFMAVWFERFFRRHMNALRVAALGRARRCRQAARWWSTPTIRPGGTRRSTSCWRATCSPGHESFAPIDAAMLGKYGFFARIGAFGVDLDSPRGAAAFLRTGADILSRPDRALWVTAQGRFADARAAAARACGPASRASPSWRRTPCSCRWRSSTPSGPSGVPRRWSPSARRCAARELLALPRAGAAGAAGGGSGGDDGPPGRRRHRARPDALPPAPGGQARHRRRLRRLAAAARPAARPAVRPRAPEPRGVIESLGWLRPGARGAARRPRRSPTSLSCAPPPAAACAAASLVSILIPARNEAASIGAALDAARAQPGRRRRDPGHGRRLDRRHGRDRPRASPRRPARPAAPAPPLPEGWAGKVHACQRLAEAARARISCSSTPTSGWRPHAAAALAGARAGDRRRPWSAACRARSCARSASC